MDDIEWIYLANGVEVPANLVKALDELEKKWPGATLECARPAIVAAILEANKLWSS